MLSRFYNTYGTARAIAILFLIIFTFAMCIKGHCWNLEIHPRYPGGEEDKIEERYKEKEQEKAMKRIEKDRKKGREPKEKDKEKERKYRKEHMAKWKKG